MEEIYSSASIRYSNKQYPTWAMNCPTTNGFACSSAIYSTFKFSIRVKPRPSTRSCFLPLILQLIQPVIDAILLQQLVMRAGFTDFAAVHYDNFIRILDG